MTAAMNAALFRASWRGDAHTVARLIAEGVDVNAEVPVDGDIMAPLLAACLNGHLPVVERLLDAGADVDALYGIDHVCALEMACDRGHDAVVERLLQAGVELREHSVGADHLQPCTGVTTASGQGHLHIVERLLAAGASYERDALEAASRNGHQCVVERLFAAAYDRLSLVPARSRGNAPAELRFAAAAQRAAQLRDDVDAALTEACGHGIRFSLTPGGGGHLHVVEWLLAHGASTFDVAIARASKHGHRAIVRRLLAAAAQADPEPSPIIALTRASASGDVATVVRLLDNPELLPFGTLDRVLEAACQNGHEAVVDALLSSNTIDHARILGTNALVAAAFHGDMAIIERLLAAGHGVQTLTAADMAVIKGHTVIVEHLLVAGGPNGFTTRDLSYWLLLAAGSGHTAMVEVLAAAGGDVTSSDHFPPILTACSEGRVDMVATLLNLGAHARGDCLARASANGHLAVIEHLLVAAGVDVDERHLESPQEPEHAGARDWDIVYWTGLMSACKHGHQAVVDRLLAAGADVHLENDLAMRFASETGDPDLVELLLRHGADPVRISWDDLPDDVWPRIVTAVPRSAFAALPADVQPVWLRFHLRLHARLRPVLQRARDRLDRPPHGPPLGAGTPTREQLIAHLKTAGRRFAREYWTEGIPIFFPGVDFGPLPDCMAAPHHRHPELGLCNPSR